MSAPSPAARQASVASDVLERLLLELRRLPGNIDRRGMRSVMQTAIESLGDLQSQDVTASDHLDVLTRAQHDVSQARAAVEAKTTGHSGTRFVRVLRAVEAALDACRAETIDEVVRRQDLTASPNAIVAPKPTLLASKGVPRLYRLDRERLTAHVDLGVFEDLGELADDRDDATDTDDERELSLHQELDDAGSIQEHPDPIRRLEVLGGKHDGPAQAQPGLSGEIAQAQRLARDCLEEIGALGTLRMLRERERWGAGIARFEERLLADLDALVSLATPFYLSSGNQARCAGINLLEEAMAHARSSFVADASRAFARTFVLGCIEGSDALRAAVLALRQSPALTLEAQARALAIAPNPAIDKAMASLCSVDDRGSIKVALEVLWMRGEVPIAPLLPLLEHGDHELRARAARCLGLVEQREAATRQLTDLLQAEVEDEVVASATEALVLLGSSAGLPLVRERLLEEFDEPGMLIESTKHRLMGVLALAGAAHDRELLARHYRHHPREAAALGWHGHCASVDVLLSTLEQPFGVPERSRLAAAQALHRITGAPLQQPQGPVDVDFYAIVKHGPSWRQWWSDNRERYQPDVKYRFGEPFGPMHSVGELWRDDTPQGLRQRAAMELAMLLERRPINVHDWYSRQRQQLLELSALIENAEEPIHVAGRFLS